MFVVSFKFFIVIDSFKHGFHQVFLKIKPQYTSLFQAFVIKHHSKDAHAKFQKLFFTRTSPQVSWT